MKVVNITNIAIASDAVNWCNEQFGEKNWKLFGNNIVSSRNPSYDFVFETEEQALLFSLTWFSRSKHAELV